MKPNRLFVGNLSYQTMENDLQEYFSQAGVVTSVNLMLDKVTGKSRGFAFVEFGTAEEANKLAGEADWLMTSSVLMCRGQNRVARR